MNNCLMCGDYKGSEDSHCFSITHLKATTEHLYRKRKEKGVMTTKDQINLENELSKCRKRLELGTFDCGNDDCEFHSNDLDVVIAHEKNCIGFVRDWATPIKKNVALVCAECGYEVMNNGQKMSPKYLMNRHKKTCAEKITKNLSKAIINELKFKTNNDLKKILQFAKQLK